MAQIQGIHFQNVKGFSPQYLIVFRNCERNSKGGELGNARTAEMSKTDFFKNHEMKIQRKKKNYMTIYLTQNAKDRRKLGKQFFN